MYNDRINYVLDYHKMLCHLVWSLYCSVIPLVIKDFTYLYVTFFTEHEEYNTLGEKMQKTTLGSYLTDIGANNIDICDNHQNLSLDFHNYF